MPKTEPLKKSAADYDSYSIGFNSPPPTASHPGEAEKYLNKIISVITQDKLRITRTNLNEYSIPSMQDHYRIILGDYDFEISHNLHPDNSQNFYTMIFNNIKQIEEGAAQKAILAYIHLNTEQFKKFKEVADTHIEKKRKEDEERRFQAALAPIDELLTSLDSSQTSPKSSSKK